MINIKNNLDVADKIIINYLVKSYDEYDLYDEMNNVLDRYKILRLINVNYFINPISSEIFKIIKSYYKDYGKIPRIKEIVEKAELDFYDVDEETIKLFFSLNLSEYSPEFVYKYLRGFVIKGQLNYRLINVMTKMKTEEINVNNVENLFDYVQEQFSSVDLEFTDASRGLDVSDARSHIQLDITKKLTGFNYFNRVLGGWEPKTLIVIQGRPKVGKSLTLGNIAVRGVEQGLNTAVVTVELGDRKYVKRLGSNLYNIPSSLYKSFTDDTKLPLIDKLIKKKEKAFPNLGYFHVKEYPTDGITTIGIETYLKNVEKRENVKFDLVVIDYLNLLKSTKDDSGNMYKKVKDIAQELRKIAQRNQWTIVTATQVKQAYFNSDDLDMGSSAESSALVATVDALFGLISPLSVQTQLPIEGTSITMNHTNLRIKCLANRDGGNMESWAIYDKNMKYFRLTEINNAGGEFYLDLEEDEDGIPKEAGRKIELEHKQERENLFSKDDPRAGFSNQARPPTADVTSFFNSQAFENQEIKQKANIIIDEAIPRRKEGIDINTNDILKNIKLNNA